MERADPGKLYKCFGLVLGKFPEHPRPPTVAIGEATSINLNSSCKVAALLNVHSIHISIKVSPNKLNNILSV